MDLDVKPSAYQRITSTTTIITGFGALTGLIVSAASATPTITIYDNIAASGTKIVDTFTPVAGQFYYFTPIGFTTGLTVAISGTVTVTVLTTK
jgi:hypothetical protein